jgi:hypothetical protein
MIEALIAGGFALGVAVLGWLLGESGRRRESEYKSRAQRYERLLVLLRGFHETTFSPAQIQEFTDEMNLCWLYCPDEVIAAAYRFVASVETGAGTTSGQRQMAAGEFIAAMRRDIFRRALLPAWGRTKLEGTDWRSLGPGAGKG